MTPQDAIEQLDRQILEVGRTITLRRFVDGAAIERQHKGFSRGYKPSELVGGLKQGDSLLVISPTGMPREFLGEDAMLREGDKIRYGGRMRNVEFVELVEIADTLVRLNVTVRG